MAGAGDWSARLADVRWQVERALESLRGSTLDIEGYRPDADDPLVEDDPRPGFEELDRYWVNAPYAFVVVDYDPAESDYEYRVVEPTLTEFERDLLSDLFRDVRDTLVYRGDYDPETAESALRREMKALAEEYGVVLDADSFYRLFYYLYRSFEGYGKIDPIMRDPHVEDISCDGYDLPVFVYHDEYDDVRTNVSYGEEELDRFVVRLAQQAGRHVSVGEPVAEVTLPDGSRGELALGEEVTPRGSAFTIRRYAERPFTPVDLVQHGTFDLDQMAYLWLCIENNRSLIFAGGTASGKTTSLNAVSMFVPPRSKMITIEDTRELTLYHDNWLSSVTRESVDSARDITMYDLLRSALRHRPEYLVVGEVRGEEAMTLFQAMNTGHTTYSTMHADSVQTVVNRLENDPINVPRAMVQSLDVLCVQTLTYVDDSRVRRSRAISEIEGVDQRTGDLDYSNAFTWRPSDDTFDRGDSNVLDDIREEKGWTRGELQRELANRRRVLAALAEEGVSDYRRFTAVVNEYYAHPDRVLDRLAGGTDDVADVTA